MPNWRQIAHGAKDILTVCLAKAIDQALTVRLGPDWFADFAQADTKEKVSLRITKTGQRCVQDLDLQALLKFLRYRSYLSNQILLHYGFFESMDSFAAEDQLRQFNGLLDRLINDFRNRIEAHSRASDIEKELSGQGPTRIYGYEEAYQDMYKLTRIFSTVTDNKGIPYYRRMAALTNQKKKLLTLITGAAALLVLICSLVAWRFSGSPPNVYRNNQTPQVQPDQVTAQPIEVYYDGDSLVAVCYIINGTDQALSNIRIDALYISDQAQELAAANFGLLKGASIAPGQAITWTFHFPKNTVSAKDPELTDPQLKMTYTTE